MRQRPIASPSRGRPRFHWPERFGREPRRAGSDVAAAVVGHKMAALGVAAAAARRSWAQAPRGAAPRRLLQQQPLPGTEQPVEMENPYKEPPKKCVLCGIKVDYKNVQLLSQFVSPYTGRIYGRHITGLCNKKQKEISKTIKRAQVLGFMPVMFKNTAFLTDPKICNIKY
ncbi:small ribosomal subunit protein bS18m [Anas platyrhynchos]|uniref:small ribosomal subunit protein bS18m n=1 Tax=Anas platyrhynchos TaxID=8839 RepID=UPI0018D7C12D|nr:28S ribosomal protein S18c, mitochondrial [Anas platyrhynchos]